LQWGRGTPGGQKKHAGKTPARGAEEPFKPRGGNRCTRAQGRSELDAEARLGLYPNGGGIQKREGGRKKKECSVAGVRTPPLGGSSQGGEKGTGWKVGAKTHVGPPPLPEARKRENRGRQGVKGRTSKKREGFTRNILGQESSFRQCSSHLHPQSQARKR